MSDRNQFNPEWEQHAREVIGQTGNWTDFVAQMMLENSIENARNRELSSGVGMFLGLDSQHQAILVQAILSDEFTVDLPNMRALYLEAHQDATTDVNIEAITAAYVEKVKARVDQENAARLAAYLALEKTREDIQ